ncbi:MAG: IS30 family transposase [Clostridia bacterium]|nr:IS30 family transposase [Clostridia bacterium]
MTHLEYSERQSIERWFNRDKRTKVEIARLLDRNEKTIRNEIKRGLVKNLTTHLEEIWVYSADVAQQRYDYYIHAKGPKLKIDNDYELKEYVEKSIKEDKKSPEVIAEEIKKMKFKTQMCARTIRNNIYSGDIYDIKPKDMIYKKIYKEKNKDKKICEKVPAEKSIDYRPEEANRREVYGHWEGDLVIGKRKRGAVLFTLTERKTREEIIMKLSSKKSEEVAKALDILEKIYKNKFSEKFKTITFDNGGEFRNWKILEKSYDNRKKSPRTQVYYAHPYRSGERGSNENANRLIRRFIPKGTDITLVSDEFIKEVENWINNYPRAMFKYKSTNQILEKLCA